MNYNNKIILFLALLLTYIRVSNAMSFSDVDDAISFIKINKVKEAIAQGFNLNSRDFSIQDADLSNSLLDTAIETAGYHIEKNNNKKDNAIKILELLLQSGANVNSIGEWGWTPLQNALSEDPEIIVINILLKYGAEVNEKILKRAQSISSEIKDLITYYYNLFNKAKTLNNKSELKDILNEAIVKDYSAIVKYLIKKDVRITQKDLESAKANNSKVVGRILVNYYNRILILSQISVQDNNMPLEILERIIKLAIN